MSACLHDMMARLLGRFLWFYGIEVFNVPLPHQSGCLMPCTCAQDSTVSVDAYGNKRGV